jgi:hypothetical protein
MSLGDITQQAIFDCDTTIQNQKRSVLAADLRQQFGFKRNINNNIKHQRSESKFEK